MLLSLSGSGWLLLSGGGHCCDMVGLTANQEVVVVFSWFICILVSIVGILKVVMAVVGDHCWVVRGCCCCFNGSCLFGEWGQ